jgi:hypothetical protein
MHGEKNDVRPYWFCDFAKVKLLFFLKTATATVSGSTTTQCMCTPTGVTCSAGLSVTQGQTTYKITQCCSTIIVIAPQRVQPLLAYFLPR